MERFLKLLSSANPQDRQLAFELCTELVFVPDEEFYSELADLLGTASSAAKVTILELLEHYEEWTDTRRSSEVLDLLDHQDDAVRLAAFRYIKATYFRPSATTMLDSLGDSVDEIRQIVTEFLQDLVLCDKEFFEVAEYLGHDNQEVREEAREMLLSNGQEDLVKRWMGN